MGVAELKFSGGSQVSSTVRVLSIVPGIVADLSQIPGLRLSRRRRMLPGFLDQCL
jgi:hypothetical protein